LLPLELTGRISIVFAGALGSAPSRSRSDSDVSAFLTRASVAVWMRVADEMHQENLAAAIRSPP
jgi:hypothetical protein